jgi:GDPmannose 4,6-dehydratase
VAQQERPDDFVIATGESHSIRELLDVAFETAGLDWHQHVEIDPRYLRPTEVNHLEGNPAKARQQLGWEPRVHFKELIQMMVRADEEDIRSSLAGRAPSA